MDISSLRRQVAKLVIVRASGYSLDSQREYPQFELPNNDLKRLLSEGVGGVILLGGSIREVQNRCFELRKWAKQPILLCADIEEGVGQRFEGGTSLIPPIALGDLYQVKPISAKNYAEQYGRVVALQARLCGLNWVLAPVCDVNTNPLNPVINVRAWGKDPKTVSELVCAFHQGVSSQGLLTCAKHFPGHGDSSVDSHLELPVLNHDLSRLDEVELAPFRRIIDQGVDSVMTSHLFLKNIDPENPVTFSQKIIRKILRQRLRFDGLIVTDALLMNAISNLYDEGNIALKAFEAGADLLMMPRDPNAAIDSIVNAFIEGKLPIIMLEKALERRRVKLEKLNRFNFCNKIEYDSCLLQNYFENTQTSLLSSNLVSETIVIKNKREIDLNQGIINLLRIDEQLQNKGFKSSSPAIAASQQMGFKTFIISDFGISPWQNKPNNPLALERFGSGRFILQLFDRGKPFSGTPYRDEPWMEVVKQLQSINRLEAIIIYGCPYFWKEISLIINSSTVAIYSPGLNEESQSIVLKNLIDINKKTYSDISLNKFTD